MTERAVFRTNRVIIMGCMYGGGGLSDGQRTSQEISIGVLRWGRKGPAVERQVDICVVRLECLC